MTMLDRPSAAEQRVAIHRMTAITAQATPNPRQRYRAISVTIPSASGLLGPLQVQPDPRGDSLFSCDGAGVPQNAAKNGEHGATVAPEVQLRICFSVSMSAARSSAELNPLSHLAVKSGLAISSADVDCGCSAFQRMAAVMRVRPLG